MQLIFIFNKKKKKNPLKIFTLDPQWVEPNLTKRDVIILVQLNIKERKLLLDFLTHSTCTGVFMVGLGIVCKKIEKTRMMFMIDFTFIIHQYNLINK